MQTGADLQTPMFAAVMHHNSHIAVVAASAVATAITVHTLQYH